MAFGEFDRDDEHVAVLGPCRRPGAEPSVGEQGPEGRVRHLGVGGRGAAEEGRGAALVFGDRDREPALQGRQEELARPQGEVAAHRVAGALQRQGVSTRRGSSSRGNRTPRP